MKFKDILTEAEELALDVKEGFRYGLGYIIRNCETSEEQTQIVERIMREGKLVQIDGTNVEKIPGNHRVVGDGTRNYEGTFAMPDGTYICLWIQNYPFCAYHTCYADGRDHSKYTIPSRRAARKFHQWLINHLKEI